MFERKILKKRKAFFYSIIVLLLLIPIVMLVLSSTEFSSSSERTLTRKLVGSQLSGFAESVKNDFPRALEISSKSATVALVAEIVSNGVPSSNATIALQSLMLNKTYNGNTSLLMGNNSLTEWVSRLQNKSRFFGFDSNISLLNISISEQSGYELLFNATLQVNLINSQQSINFSRVFYSDVAVSTEGIEDPLYALNSFGLVKRQILLNATPVYGGAGMEQAVSSKWYLPSNISAGFLERLEGKNYLVYSTQGIETFVNVEEFTAQGLIVKSNQSQLDYYYFSNSSPAGFSINYTGFSHPLFKLDNSTAIRYGVTLLSS